MDYLNSVISLHTLTKVMRLFGQATLLYL